MYPGPPRPRRARPVFELPLAQLLSRVEDLTKGWLLALIEDAPLDQAGAILTAGLVREGPRLCEGVLRALIDDEELRALDRGGRTGRLIFQAGELAGARDAEGAVRAIDALGSAIWSAVLPALPEAEGDQVARLAERLAMVLREVRAAAVRRYSAVGSGAPGGTPDGPGRPGATSDRPGRQAPERVLRRLYGGGAALYTSGPARTDAVEPMGEPPVEPPMEPPVEPGRPEPASRAGAERRAEPAPVTDPEQRADAAPAPGADTAPRPEPGAGPPVGLRSIVPGPGEDTPRPPLEPVRDELWMRALDEEIETSRRGGVGLSLLLIELEEAERIRTVEDTSEMGASFGRFAQAMRTALRRRDILACETDTRAWIVARDTMRAGAQALGGRIAGAVQAAEPWRGAPLTISVGVAVLGEDGQDREALIGAAEQDRFAAAASGTPVLGEIFPEGEGQEPPGPWAG